MCCAMLFFAMPHQQTRIDVREIPVRVRSTNEMLSALFCLAFESECELVEPTNAEVSFLLVFFFANSTKAQWLAPMIKSNSDRGGYSRKCFLIIFDRLPCRVTRFLIVCELWAGASFRFVVSFNRAQACKLVSGCALLDVCLFVPCCCCCCDFPLATEARQGSLESAMPGQNRRAGRHA